MDGRLRRMWECHEHVQSLCFQQDRIHHQKYGCHHGVRCVEDWLEPTARVCGSCACSPYPLGSLSGFGRRSGVPPFPPRKEISPDMGSAGGTGPYPRTSSDCWRPVAAHAGLTGGRTRDEEARAAPARKLRLELSESGLSDMLRAAKFGLRRVEDESMASRSFSEAAPPILRRMTLRPWNDDAGVTQKHNTARNARPLIRGTARKRSRSVKG